MKIDWNKKYDTIAAYSIIVICISIVLYFIASRLGNFNSKIAEFKSIIQPFIIGGVLAYIINFILKFYEDVVFEFKGMKKIQEKYKRTLAITFSYITALFILVVFIMFVLPQVMESIRGLANSIPQYVNSVTELITEFAKKQDIKQEHLSLIVDKWKEVINYIITFISEMAPVVGNFIFSIGSSILNIILGIIISIYILADKEKFIALSRKLVFSIFSEKASKRILEIASRSNDTFGKFLSGKILDSLIIGILTFVILIIFKMPYALLISVIIGITNIIPVFGPFFGAIPSTIIILCVSPIKALWFIVIIIVIQQIDGNIIGPKILGDSIGISPFWILFSILIFGKLLGVVGMIIGVPVFAVIYSVIKEIVENKLRRKGLPIETEKYK